MRFFLTSVLGGRQQNVIIKIIEKVPNIIESKLKVRLAKLIFFQDILKGVRNENSFARPFYEVNYSETETLKINLHLFISKDSPSEIANSILCMVILFKKRSPCLKITI